MKIFAIDKINESEKTLLIDGLIFLHYFYKNKIELETNRNEKDFSNIHLFYVSCKYYIRTLININELIIKLKNNEK